jgi:predicted nucleic acid-binding protein
MIVDASVILSAFFPDEEQIQAQAVIHAHVAERERLTAPTILLYEVTNGVIRAIRQGRITAELGESILSSFEDLGILMEPVMWQQILPLAQRFGRSAYDAAYLALAEATGQPFVTGDERMYNAVHEHLDWVRWIEDYQGAG